VAADKETGQHAVDDLFMAYNGFGDLGLDGAVIVAKAVAKSLKLRVDAGNVGLCHR
jgi:hypothetical protein